MMRRSAGTEDEHAVFTHDLRSRPLPMRITGWLFLMGATVLILGGAFRAQSNMVTTGLVFLAMGVAFAPGTLRMGWLMSVALGALALVGAIYVFIT